jgi:hypothetical protein
MPEGKDFVDERAVWFVAGAAVEVEGSFDCLLAGLSRPRPKKRRRIVANVPCVGHVLRDGDIWTLTLTWPLDLTSVALGRLQQL